MHNKEIHKETLIKERIKEILLYELDKIKGDSEKYRELLNEYFALSTERRKCDIVLKNSNYYNSKSNF